MPRRLLRRGIGSRIVGSGAAIVSDGDSFYPAVLTIKVPNTTIFGALFQNTNTFYGGTISVGAVTVTQSSSFINAQTFYGGAVSTAYTVTQNSIFANSQTFYGGVVLPGNVNVVQSAAFANSNVFYGGQVLAGAVSVVQNSVFANSQVFYGGVVLPGSVTVTQNAPFTNASVFHGGSVSISSSSQTVTQDTAFENATVFYGGNILVTADDTSAQFAWVQDNYRRRRSVSTKIAKKAADAELTKTEADVIADQVIETVKKGSLIRAPDYQAINNILKRSGVQYTENISKYTIFVWKLITQSLAKRLANEKIKAERKKRQALEKEERENKEREELLFLLEVLEI